MGSPDFAVPTVARLAATHDLCAVYSQPAKKSGRGMAERPVPVAAWALDHDIPLFTPDNLKAASIHRQLAQHQADIFVVVAYGLLLPPAVLAIPRWGCLNGHASLLPRWRGAAPIQRAIEAGDRETGVAAMLMEAGLDTGPVVATRRTPIAPDDTAGSLHDRLAEMTAACLGAVIDNLPDSLATPTPQAEDGIVYAAKISPADAEIDWQKPAKRLDYHIRAFSPVPGAWCIGPKGRLRLLAGHPAPIPDGTPNLPAGCFLGKSAEGAMLIRCGDAAFAVTTVQPAGKKPMPADAFLNGCNLVVGAPLASLSDTAPR